MDVCVRRAFEGAFEGDDGKWNSRDGVELWKECKNEEWWIEGRMMIRCEWCCVNA